MSASDWVAVAGVAECPPGAVLERVAGEDIVALFHVDGRIVALDGICPHQGGPLGQGRLCGTVVTCPWHGWQFDVVTGRHQVNPRLRHRRFDVRIENDQIWVRPEADDP